MACAFARHDGIRAVFEAPLLQPCSAFSSLPQFALLELSRLCVLGAPGVLDRALLPSPAAWQRYGRAAMVETPHNPFLCQVLTGDMDTSRGLSLLMRIFPKEGHLIMDFLDVVQHCILKS